MGHLIKGFAQEIFYLDPDHTFNQVSVNYRIRSFFHWFVHSFVR